VEQKAKMVDLMREDNDKLRESIEENRVKKQQVIDE
jgi:hypothetical protein